MRREALDREWPGDTHLAGVCVRLVVQVLEFRLRGDRGIDLPLAPHTVLPPLLVQRLRLRRPLALALARDLPRLPRLLDLGVQPPPQRLEDALELLPDDVDLRVVGDIAQLDVGNALKDEALADVAMGWGVRGLGASDLGFLRPTLSAVREKVVRVACTHDPSPSEGECDPGSVDGDPAPTPLLGYICGGPAAARRVEYKVPGIGGHQDTALDDPWQRLYDEHLVCCKAGNAGICPVIRERGYTEIIKEAASSGECCQQGRHDHSYPAAPSPVQSPSSATLPEE